MLPIQVISDRFRAMYHVATVIQTAWLWTIMSLGEMGSNLSILRGKLDALDTAETDMLEARGLLDGELGGYRANLRAFLRVGKLRHRATPTKHKLLKPLRLQGTGRDATLATGRKVEKAWKKIGQTFVPVPAVTFAATHDCGVRCVQLDDEYSMKETEWRDKVMDVQDFAGTLDRANIEWYATATTAFPAGTRSGDLIRTMVPTNNNSVQPVAQAIIDEAVASPDGKVELKFHAAHATSYRLWHKAPGAAEWTLVAKEIDGLIQVVPGVTAAGEHKFQVAGENSKGVGDVSKETVVKIPEVAVA